MKKKLIFTVAATVFLQLPVAIAVENANATVDKEYQHELICQASTKTENFELNIKWSVEHIHLPDGRAPLVKKQFNYELTNLSSGQVIKDTYGNFFGRYADIKTSESELVMAGQFFMNKRLGYMERAAEITFGHDGAGNYFLKSFVNKRIETFHNPNDYCSPKTRLCATEPTFPDSKILFSYVFAISTCRLLK